MRTPRAKASCPVCRAVAPPASQQRLLDRKAASAAVHMAAGGGGARSEEPAFQCVKFELLPAMLDVVSW